MTVIWVLTDGKAGDFGPCEGVAAAVARFFPHVSIISRVVAPRLAYRVTAPWGPADPLDLARFGAASPDILIGTGRRAVPAFRALKRRWPSIFAVFIKDPRVGTGADLVWVPEHDALRGPDVLVTPTSPNRLTPEALAKAAALARPALTALPRPRVAVLLGGATAGGVRFTPAEIEALAARLARLADTGAGLMVTPSRRTPAALLAGVRRAVPSAWVWDGTGDNPYLEMLALADAVVVTGDSMNMLGEAAATGRPIHVFAPAGLKPKQRRAIAALEALGAAVPFEGRLESLTYAPLNSTPILAAEIVRRYRSRAVASSGVSAA